MTTYAPYNWAALAASLTALSTYAADDAEPTSEVTA